jgi:predicted unusual protein kinase regulating ubiquinone biosynthesis (AarF/ABC1/UbiB family)
MQKVESNLLPMLPPRSEGKAGDEDLEGLLNELSIDVSLPQVVEEYVTEKMLVMSFIDGFKVRE